MRPVTGPDGDNPITDEQIRELQQTLRGDWSAEHAACAWALNSKDPPFPARARCADAYNARRSQVVKVTGETITNEQILELEAARLVSFRDAWDALGDDPSESWVRARARSHCADAWNARHGAES